jgi:hypothetical protein
MRKSQFNLAQPTLGRLQYAPMATMSIRHTHAHHMAITGRITLTAACLLAQGLGSMDSTVAATMADGAATVVEVSMEDEAGTTVAVDSVVEADGRGVMDSAGTRASTAAEDSMVAAPVAATGFMVAAGSAAVMPEVSTAVGEAGPMVAVAAGSTEEVVVAGPTGEATGNRYRILQHHFNGWQRMLPAVFYFPFSSPNPNF